MNLVIVTFSSTRTNTGAKNLPGRQLQCTPEPPLQSFPTCSSVSRRGAHDERLSELAWLPFLPLNEATEERQEVKRLLRQI